jgi:hypothetical protein
MYLDHTHTHTFLSLAFVPFPRPTFNNQKRMLIATNPNNIEIGTKKKTCIVNCQFIKCNIFFGI